jgi:outer membrane protein OmpA-like peptidoglycan-associated protein
MFGLALTKTSAQRTDTLTVHFDYNQSVLVPADRQFLDHRFGPSSPPAVWIELAGYCDNAGEASYNDSLSIQRIDAVKQYLHSKGIADSLFKTLKPFGKRNPLNDNGDEQKRSLNRRVTIFWRTGAPSGGALEEALKDSAGVVGKTFSLNVLFYGDMHRLMPVSYPALQSLLTIMKAHPGLKIEIQGYVCCMPDELDGRDIETKKDDLSEQRAKTVYNYLTAHGIDTTRMRYKGFGGSHKIFPLELDDTQRLRNRRVEIKVLGW